MILNISCFTRSHSRIFQLKAMTLLVDLLAPYVCPALSSPTNHKFWWIWTKSALTLFMMRLFLYFSFVKNYSKYLMAHKVPFMNFSMRSSEVSGRSFGTMCPALSSPRNHKFWWDFIKPALAPFRMRGISFFWRKSARPCQ